VTLVVDGVRKGFGGRWVLDGVGLTVAAGEVVAVAGRSGSGKTTLLTIAAGWERPDAGTVTVVGRPPADGVAWHEVALLPQSLGLLDELTVAENVALPLRLGGTAVAGDPDALMARLGIAHLAGRYPAEASLGEQQRAALARAAVSGPRLLLADEPTAHQNQGRANDVVAVLRDLAAAGTACLLATHDAATLAAADRILHLDAGRLTAPA